LLFGLIRFPAGHREGPNRIDIFLAPRQEKGGSMERDELKLLIDSLQRGGGFFGGVLF